MHLSAFRSKLVIIDPCDHKNNVALKTSEIKNIHLILKLIYYSCKSKCDCSCHYLKSSNDNDDQDIKAKDDDKENGLENLNFVELGTEHCILKKIFKTAYRINSNC